MFKPSLSSRLSTGIKRLQKWALQVKAYGRHRSQSDYRAVSLATRLTISGALQPPRAVPTIARTK